MSDCDIDSDLESMVWALGARIVNCLTIRPSSARFAVTAVPLLEPFPGLPEIPCSSNRGRAWANEPPEAITALVLLAWSLWRAKNIRSADYRPLRLLTVQHKAIFAEVAGLEWWSRACSCDRAAIALIGKDIADELEVEAAAHARRRPKKTNKPCLYAYLGGGVAFQPDGVSTIVVHTTDMDLLAVVVAAAQLARATWPSGGQSAAFDEGLVENADDCECEVDFKARVEAYAVVVEPGEAARAAVRNAFQPLPRPGSRGKGPRDPSKAGNLISSVIDLEDPVLLGAASDDVAARPEP